MGCSQIRLQFLIIYRFDHAHNELSHYILYNMRAYVCLIQMFVLTLKLFGIQRNRVEDSSIR